MEIEDLTAQTQAAVQCLMRGVKLLRLPALEITPLSEFLALAAREPLKGHERRTIVQNAILMIEQLYSHLPFKCARYAINPSRRLRLLLTTMKRISAMEFHMEMLDIFFELRDAHTFYSLPEPYAGRAAFLPFLLGGYGEDRRPRFVVTQVMDALEHPSFVAGVEVTHWNGAPVRTAVARMAELTPAGNASARFVRGMARLTLRMLKYSPVPDEEMVFVQYRPLAHGASERVVAMPWNVAKGMPKELFAGRSSSVCAPLSQSGMVRQCLWLRDSRIRQQDIQDKCRKWKPGWDSKKKPGPIRRAAAGPDGVDLGRESMMPECFEFQCAGGDPAAAVKPEWLADRTGKNRKLGYLRIKQFQGESEDLSFADQFVAECERIVRLLQRQAPDGLILDLRGNPGGEIPAAERILQFFTPLQITPAPFHFVNTPLIQELATQLQNRTSAALGAQSDLDLWLKDILSSITEGNLVTSGHPITEPELANNTGQIYQGPVVALMDARVYSAAEIFLGGFQDHAIGKLIGLQETTGGGGANRWLFSEVADVTGQVSGLSFKVAAGQGNSQELPRGAGLAVAIRRSSRTGGFTGSAIEDAGVSRDVVYKATRGDLTSGGRDLIRFACDKLLGGPVSRLDIRRVERGADKVSVTVVTANVERLECYLDGKPQLVVPVPLAPGERSFGVPLEGLLGLRPKRLTLKGFKKEKDPDSRGRILRLKASASIEIGGKSRSTRAKAPKRK